MGEYYESVLPERFTLLGQSLKTLSLGHILHLERHGCLPVESPEQLVTAVIVCSSEPNEIESVLTDPWLHWKIRIWRTFLGEPNWAESYVIWETYFNEHSNGPVVMTSDEGGLSDSATPFIQHLKVTLQSKLNYSPSEVMAVSYSQALHDYYVYFEINSDVDIVDPKEIDEELKRIEDNKEQILEEMRRVRNGV